MTRYNSFILHGVKYYTEDFVRVAAGAAMERQNSLPSATKVAKKPNYWVANNTYTPACIGCTGPRSCLWVLWTARGKSLVASHTMDSMSWSPPITGSLYWRQAFNWRTSELSSVALVCKCRTPANPDKTLIGCSKKTCEKWMHYECLLADVLTRVYDRLGTDIPHKSEKSAIKEETKEDTKDEPKEGTKGDLPYGLLSPSVEGEDRKSPIVANSEIKDQVLMKQRDNESSKDTETPTPAPPDPSDKSSKSALAKRGKRKKSSKKPW
ncbi:hypothetical protein V8C42DRAFT_362262 [Trichoderma barbatum]